MASGIAGKGMNGFVYTIDETGGRGTLSLPGRLDAHRSIAGRCAWMAVVRRRDPERQARRPSRKASRRGSGAFLLEALVATLVFAFGALAVAGFQARAVRHVNAAQFRGEAVHSSTQRWVRSVPRTPQRCMPTSIRAPPATGYRALLERAKRLPGVTDSSNAPDVRVDDGPSLSSRRVDITLFWQLPGDASVHRHSATAVVAGN